MLESLSNLYQLMDDAWSRIAALYQFQCNGCQDNCCKSLFFHHTHIEKVYLRHGFDQLESDRKNDILNKAEDYCRKTFLADGEIKNLKIMCPLNEKSRCILYPYRPMICRLHGLPHELRKPGSNPVIETGCRAGRFDSQSYFKFDRTLFYQKMAHLEIYYRQTSKKKGKINETIAQMLISQ